MNEMKDDNKCASDQMERDTDLSLNPSVEHALNVIEQKLSSDESIDTSEIDAESLSLLHTMEDIDRVLAAQNLRIPDVDEEYERFLSRRNAKENIGHAEVVDIASRSPRYFRRWIFAAAAAVIGLLLVFTFWKQPSGSLLAEKDSQSSLSEENEITKNEDGTTTILKRTEDDQQITLQAGSKTMTVKDGDSNYESVLAQLTKDQKETVIIRIPRGKVHCTNLSDGTKVWLNADSKLLYPVSFNGSKERRVRLEGEAYFQVAKDADHPFIVEVGESFVKVLGTEFNINTRSGEQSKESEITLITGSISLNPTNGKDIILKPGQQALLDAQSSLLSIADVSVDPYVYWKNGSFYFDDADIGSILKEIGRWYNLTIKLGNDDVLKYKFHFIADRNDSIEQIVDLLNQMDKITIRKRGNVIYAY